MKKLTALILTLVILCGLLSGCGKTAEPAAVEELAAVEEPVTVETQTPAEAEPAVEETPTEREFTDDCGRTVTIPYEITKIAVSGPLAQIYILPVASDIMVGYANEFSEDAQKYIKDEFLALPALGQLYGGKGTMDLEALLAASPQVVIDVGEAKGSIVEDLDGLTEQTGIPFVHIDATVSTAPEAYTRIGELLGREELCAEVAEYLQYLLDKVNGVMERVDAGKARRTVLYCLGDKGLNVLAEGSYHAETINIAAKNAAELADVVSSGAGNEVDMEQLILWNPEYLIFAPDSVYSEVGGDETWQQLDAIKSGHYVETPYGPYGWLQSPPSVQRYLGMIWLVDLLYPEYSDIDLKTEVQHYYKLFYDYDLSDSEFMEMTANAFPG